MGLAFVLGVLAGERVDMGEVVDAVPSRLQCNLVAADEAVERGVCLRLIRKICGDGLAVGFSSGGKH